jgi:hypothetical protein
MRRVGLTRSVNTRAGTEGITGGRFGYSRVPAYDRPGTGSRFLVLTGVIALLLISCGGGSDMEEIEMPETSVLSLRAEWGVVTEAYTRVYVSPEAEARINAHLRQNSVVEITDKSTFSDTMNDREGHWYRIRTSDVQGWIFGASLDLYNSEQQARNAADASSNS